MKKYRKNADDDPEIGHFNAAKRLQLNHLQCSMTIAEMNGVLM